MANKLDMYGLVGYRKVQLFVYWLRWSYPCHHSIFLNTTSSYNDCGPPEQIDDGQTAILCKKHAKITLFVCAKFSTARAVETDLSI